MNQTHIEHSVIAVTIQIIVGFITGDYLLGASFASAIFIGREIGQAEYRYIERFNKGKREGIPIFAGLHPKVWNKLDPWLDWLLPTIACYSLAAYKMLE